MKTRLSLRQFSLIAAALYLLPLPGLRAQTTAFTYQGVLTEAGLPATGAYDLEFRVFDSPAGGNQLGGTVIQDGVGITNGLFTTQLDFGPGIFNGSGRWLNVAVRPGPSLEAFTSINPRQPIVATPYASFAGGVDATGIKGTLADTKLSSNVARRDVDNHFTGNQIINGGRLGLGIELDDLAAALHINPQSDPNNALVISVNPFSGGYSALAMGLSSVQGGYGWIQGVKASGSLWGDVVLNPNAGNVGIGKTNPATRLDIAGEATMTACNITSDRNAKEQFKAVDPRAVLEKVARLPISEWQYKTQSDARHVGPMAQDFREAFGLGRDDRHITSVDADGVALAAIQGLNLKLEAALNAKDQELDALKQQLVELKQLLNAAQPRTSEVRP